MSFVQYVSSSPEGERGTNLPLVGEVRQRRRSRARNAAAWCLNRAAGTALERPLEAMFCWSAPIRMAGAVTLGIVLGAAFDLTLASFRMHSAIVPGLLGMTFAIAASGGPAGGLGALAGALWGWLLAQVTDAAVSQVFSGPAERVLAPIIAWTVAILAGWVAGKAVEWCADRVMARYPKTRPYVVGLAITVSLFAALMFLYGIGRWGLHHVHTGTSIRFEISVVLTVVAIVSVGLICLAAYRFIDRRWVLYSAITIISMVLLAAVNALLVLSVCMICDAWGWRPGWLVVGDLSGFIGAVAFVVVVEAPVIIPVIWRKLQLALSGRASLLNDEGVCLTSGIAGGVLTFLLGMGGASYLAAMPSWWRAAGILVLGLAAWLGFYLGRKIVTIPEVRQCTGSLYPR